MNHSSASCDSIVRPPLLQLHDIISSYRGICFLSLFVVLSQPISSRHSFEGGCHRKGAGNTTYFTERARERACLLQRISLSLSLVESPLFSLAPSTFYNPEKPRPRKTRKKAIPKMVRTDGTAKQKWKSLSSTSEKGWAVKRTPLEIEATSLPAYENTSPRLLLLRVHPKSLP